MYAPKELTDQPYSPRVCCFCVLRALLSRRTLYMHIRAFGSIVYHTCSYSIHARVCVHLAAVSEREENVNAKRINVGVPLCLKIFCCVSYRSPYIHAYGRLTRSLPQKLPRPRVRVLRSLVDQEYNNLFDKTLECDQGCPGCEFRADH